MLTDMQLASEYYSKLTEKLTEEVGDFNEELFFFDTQDNPYLLASFEDSRIKLFVISLCVNRITDSISPRFKDYKRIQSKSGQSYVIFIGSAACLSLTQSGLWLMGTNEQKGRFGFEATTFSGRDARSEAEAIITRVKTACLEGERGLYSMSLAVTALGVGIDKATPIIITDIF